MTTASVVASSRPRRTPNRPLSAGRRAAQRRRAFTGWMFIAPFGVVFLLFLVAPLAYAFYLSLFTKGLATGTEFAWFSNYIAAFTDPSFLRGVGFVVSFSLVLIPIQMLVSLVVALILDAVTTRFARFTRLVIFLPYAIPAVIGAIMWGFLYSPTFGPVGQVFSLFGAHAPFLLDADHVFGALVNVVTWQWAGYYMIIIYAALRGIDPSIYEAATIDGATPWQRFTNVTLPGLRPVSMTVVLLGTIWTFNMFSVIYLVTGGQPAGQTEILVTGAYRAAFEGIRNYALSATYGVLILSILLVFSVFYRRLLRRQGEVW